MLSDQNSVTAHTRIARPSAKAAASRRAAGPPSSATLLDGGELESLMLNIEIALRVHTRQQYFAWTQGALQGLVAHELLLCALCDARRSACQVECYARPAIDPQRFSGLFQRDAELVAAIVARWAEADFRPVTFDSTVGAPFADSAVGSALRSIGTSSVIAHGLPDALGKPATLFVFAGESEALRDDHRLGVELIVPYLHLAWMRAQVQGSVEGPGPGSKIGYALTGREKEILHWVHLGKSNYEIGAILGISPFTVKNHLHKILRKLNAQNRAHAVGRALALHLLDV